MKIIQMRRKTAFLLSFFLITSSLMISLLSFYPATFGEPPFSTNVKINSGGSANRVAPSMAVDSEGIVYCAWGDWRNGDWDIYFTKSIDQGSIWISPDIKVNSGSENQTYPSIAVSTDGSLFAVWQDDRNGDSDIYFASSSDSGQSWSSTNIRVSKDSGTTVTANKTQENPKIAVDLSGVIYVVWQDYRWGDYDIYFAKSTDRGLTWTDPNLRINRDSQPSPDQMNPTIAVDSLGYIYVAWDEVSGGDKDIFFSKSTDGGVTWSDPHIMVNTDSESEEQEYPTIDVDLEGNIYVAWQDRRQGDWDVYFAGSFDGGATWTNPNVKVDNSTSDWQSYPSIAVSETGTIYAAWQDSRNGPRDIYFAYSIDKGYSWSIPDLNVIEETINMNQLNPTIAVGSNGPVHVAWQDNRHTTNDIYSAYLDPIHPFPFADRLKVQGFSDGTPEIQHIIPHKPTLSFRYTDPKLVALSQYNVSIWNSDATSLLWFCNMTDSMSSGMEKTVTYDTAPCPENGPALLDGTTYLFRVKAANSTGYWSPESEINFHLNEILVPQSPISPSDNSLLNAFSNHNVSWSSPGSDSEGDSPTAFNWEVASDPLFSDIIESGSGLAFQSDPFNTRPSGTFYWRVSLSDGWETGSFGNQPDGYWDFTTYTQGDPNNNPPTITNKGDVPTKITVNGTLTFKFLATDPDNDTLSWSKVSGATWLQIGTENGTIYGRPLLESIGANSFAFQVSDGRGGLDNHTFTINVSSDSNGNGDEDGDEQESDDPILIVCWVLLIIVIIILLLLFFIILKKSREKEEENKRENEGEEGQEEEKEQEDENVEGEEDVSPVDEEYANDKDDVTKLDNEEEKLDNEDKIQ